MMRRLSLSSFILSISLGFIQGCDKEDPFVCNNNTVSTVNGKKECGTSQVMYYEGTTTSDYFKMHVAGGYTVTLQTTGGKLVKEGETYYVPVGFSNINRTIENSIKIIKLDRANKILTFSFDFHNEAESNYQAYALKANGTVTEINW